MMETKMTLAKMIAALNDLTAEELLQLNKQLGVIYKAKNRVNRQVVASAQVATGKFQIGDIIKFYKSGRSQTAGYNYFRFDKMNRNGDCMQGPPCNADGSVIQGLGNWTVGLTQPTLEVIFRGGKPITA